MFINQRPNITKRSMIPPKWAYESDTIITNGPARFLCMNLGHGII